MSCEHPRHAEYPYFGVGPHLCFYKRGPGFVPGQSLAVPRGQWPANFTPDPDDPVEDDTAPVGVWTCPGCATNSPRGDRA